jgi:hypothetical protein
MLIELVVLALYVIHGHCKVFGWVDVRVDVHAGRGFV